MASGMKKQPSRAQERIEAYKRCAEVVKKVTTDLKAADAQLKVMEDNLQVASSVSAAWVSLWRSVCLELKESDGEVGKPAGKRKKGLKSKAKSSETAASLKKRRRQ